MPNQGTQSGGFHRKAWTPAQCVFQQRFCHRTAANIADANDEYVSERPYLGGNCHSTSVADKNGTVTLTMTGLPPPHYLGAKEFAGELALRNNNILLAPFLGVSPGTLPRFLLNAKTERRRRETNRLESTSIRSPAAIGVCPSSESRFSAAGVVLPPKYSIQSSR